MKKTLSLITLTMISVTTAFADAAGAGSKLFENHISAYQKSCLSECQVPFSEQLAFDFQNPQQSQINSQIRGKLEKVAWDQAQIWGDTILEGDYYSAGHTQLDLVSAIYENGQFLGYKITYSEHAWYTGDCSFAEGQPETLKECNEGRISESSFVSPDFQTYFRDEQDLADFEALN
jgi:hypothetical protein